MTNKEKAKEIANKDRSVDQPSYYDGLLRGAMEMAQWKDEQLEAEKQALIDKACEWLEKHINNYLVKGRDIDYMFDDFLKAMKGGEQ